MQEYMTPVGEGSPAAGRNEVPFEVAVAAQSRLLEQMIPEGIRPYLQSAEDDLEKNDPILMSLGDRFADKYLLNFNGFTEYCNNKSEDQEFMERAKLGQFTDEDYLDMMHFLETSEHGQPFFADDAAEQDFLKQHVH